MPIPISEWGGVHVFCLDFAEGACELHEPEIRAPLVHTCTSLATDAARRGVRCGRGLQVGAALLERHKLVFALHLSASLSRVPAAQLAFLATGGSSLGAATPPNPAPEWLASPQWAQVRPHPLFDIKAT